MRVSSLWNKSGIHAEEIEIEESTIRVRKKVICNKIKEGCFGRVALHWQ